MLGWLLEKPIAFGSANTLRCLPLESQLPLKPCFALQPFQFKGNCDSSDLLLDFCYSFSCSLICFANVGYSPTPRQHFCKTAAPKNFYLPAARSQQPYIYIYIYIPLTKKSRTYRPALPHAAFALIQFFRTIQPVNHLPASASDNLFQSLCS